MHVSWDRNFETKGSPQVQAFIIKSVRLCFLSWQFYKDDPEDCSYGVVNAKGEY